MHPVSNLFISDRVCRRAAAYTRTQSNHGAQFQIVNLGKGIELKSMDIEDLLEDSVLECICSNDDADIDQLFLAAFTEDPTLSVPNPALPPDTSPLRSLLCSPPFFLQQRTTQYQRHRARTIALPFECCPYLQSQRLQNLLVRKKSFK